MRIKKIELCNFGSYAGVCEFDLQANKKGNIVLIGGKNGAGKTTLFSGIKLCLYGNKAAGFENINAHYRKEVKKYINDVSRFDISSKCYVKLDMLFSNGQEDDVYVITRGWNNSSDSLDEFEELIVEKNGTLLNSEELADFDNYVMNIIPPELFELFFFDGEQIADYFLGENGNERVKNAFMILCGYDTFDIMQKNFKRLAFGKKVTEGYDINYIEVKQQVEQAEKEYDDSIIELKNIKDEIDYASGEIKDLDKKYKLSGGVTYDEWSEKLLQIKEEERIREEKNLQLKKMANEVVPYIIVKELLEKLSVQLLKEHDKQQHELLQESLKSILPGVMHKVCSRLNWQDNIELTDLIIEEINNEMELEEVSEVPDIIGLSGEEYIVVQNAIVRYMAMDKECVIAAEREVKDSIERTQKLRQEIESCNVEGAHEYLQNKTKLVEKINELNQKMQDCIEKIQLYKTALEEKKIILKREEKKFDEVSKNISITELSEKSVAFLDVLQSRLYSNEIKKVEEFFMVKIKELARKNNFIDSIMIDTNFNVHIYKNITFDTKRVCNRIKKLGVESYWTEYGTVHCQGLLTSANVKDLNEFVSFYDMKNEKISILQEIEKSRLSKGEKQVFIMALYWSFMKLNKQEVPFVIDTPFARIDTEHRANITKRFFMDLSGQVFIFSTNEEIVGENYEKMKNRIQAEFLLENSDNLQTIVYANEYFGG